ncbi:unnamed protein product [Orchesella dallaii]|uniref:Uncharacterized protein n=1 Tax=Orchesella dallaii TaxID=48710 RepID=A0ABP1RUP5_9HEXA
MIGIPRVPQSITVILFGVSLVVTVLIMVFSAHVATKNVIQKQMEKHPNKHLVMDNVQHQINTDDQTIAPGFSTPLPPVEAEASPNMTETNSVHFMGKQTNSRGNYKKKRSINYNKNRIIKF